MYASFQKYRDQVSDLARTIEPHVDNVEVSLAVKFSAESTSKDGVLVTRTTVEDEEGLDEFLSSHSFEFVDGDRGGRKPTGDGGGFDDEDESGMSQSSCHVCGSVAK